MRARTVVLLLLYFGISASAIVAGSLFAGRLHHPSTALDVAVANATRTISSANSNANQRLLAYYSRAQLYRLQDKPDAAIADYHAILQDPAGGAFAPYARAGLIATYSDKHDYDEALAQWNAAMDGHVPGASDLLIRGTLYTEMGDYARAQSDLDAVLSKAPGYLPVYVARYRLFLAEGAYDAAFAEVAKLEQHAPYYPGVHGLRAWIYLRRLDLLDAWREYRTQIDVQKAQRNLVAIARRAQQESTDLHFDAAIADCTTILAARPKAFYYRLMRDVMYGWKGETEKALADIRAVQIEQPVLPVVHSDLADIYAETFRFADAAEEYGTAATFSPQPEIYRRSRGVAEFAMGHYDDAATDLAAAVALNPQDGYATIWLHLTRMRLHQDDKAEFAKNAAAIASPDWPRPLIEYMTGSRDALALSAAANDASLPGTLRDQNCEADYYIGILALDRGDRATGLDNLRSAARFCHPGFIEHTMALWALKQAG